MKTKFTIPDLTKPDGSLSKDDLDKANILVNFFSSIFTKENTSNIPTVNNKIFTRDLSSIEVTLEDVRDKLRKLKTNKSSGPTVFTQEY